MFRFEPILFAMLTIVANASAEPVADDLDPNAGLPHPKPSDQRTWSPIVHTSAEVVVPGGMLSDTYSASDFVAPGIGFSADIGIGLSRYLVLDARAGYASFSNSVGCHSCSGTTHSLGLDLAYHLTQSIAVDPWVRYGIAYRRSVFTSDTLISTSSKPLSDEPYIGLDFARLAIGSDFYPTPFLGLGPYIELDLGTYVDRPIDRVKEHTQLFFQAGFQISLDPFKKPVAVRTVAKTYSTELR